MRTKYIKNGDNMERVKKIFNKYKGPVFLSLIILLFAFTIYEYYSVYYKEFRSPKEIKNLIVSYKQFSVGVYILLQIVQVVIFFIPGEVVQISGGYIFGSLWGTILSLIGITIGSSFVFFLSKLTSKLFLQKEIERKKLSFLKKALKGKNGTLIIFIVFLIPGLPKDIIGYVCGLYKIDFKEYIIYSTIGRAPGIVITSYFGANLFAENYLRLVIIATVASILFVLGVLYGKKIIMAFSKH